MTSTIPAIEVRSPRLLLRPLEPGDRAAQVEFMQANDDHFRPWQPAPTPGSTFNSRFDQTLTRSSEAVATGRELRLFAFSRESAARGAIVGWFNLNNVARGVFQNAYAGWALGREWTGRGLATEGVRALLDIAFAPAPHGMGLHRVQANVMPANAPSIAVAERCGFTREGLCRKYLEIAGQWEDHHMFAKLATEHPLENAELLDRLPQVLLK